jgi:hypothetical protein
MIRRLLARTLLAIILATALPLVSYAQECPAEGQTSSGGIPPAAKQELNRLKNRTAFPSNIELIKVPDVVNLGTTRDPEHEQLGVTVEGFLLDFKHEGPESPNCYSDTRKDFHMWLGPKRPSSLADARTKRQDSVVVEPTPAMQEAHPSWTEESFKSLRSKRIRVTGWLMFDPEHPNQIGNTRATLWEVHPVMKIDVFQNGQWTEF